MAAYKDPQPLPQLDSTTWAYVAGIVDGEGSLVAHPGTNAVRLNVNMADELPRWLHEQLGGQLSIHHSASAQSRGHRPQLMWRIARQARLLYVLEQLLPYLRVKHRQAELTISFLEIARNSPPSFTARQDAFAQLLTMNKIS